jgi:hypothetical protein
MLLPVSFSRGDRRRLAALWLIAGTAYGNAAPDSQVLRFHASSESGRAPERNFRPRHLIACYALHVRSAYGTRALTRRPRVRAERRLAEDVRLVAGARVVDLRQVHDASHDEAVTLK